MPSYIIIKMKFLNLNANQAKISLDQTNLDKRGRVGGTSTPANTRYHSLATNGNGNGIQTEMLEMISCREADNPDMKTNGNTNNKEVEVEVSKMNQTSLSETITFLQVRMEVRGE